MKDPDKPWPPRFPSAPPGRDRRTLSEIEGVDWGEPTCDSHLVRTCHALRHKPIGTFTVEDMRIMIGQRLSLPVLVPLAVDHLEENPLAEGDFFPGDLLKNVLQVDASYWRAHPEQHRRVRGIAKNALVGFEERARVVEGSTRGERGGIDVGGVVVAARAFMSS